MTIEELEAIIRALGCKRNLMRGQNGKYLAIEMFGAGALVLDQYANIAASMRDYDNLAVVATAAEVSEVLRAWGCVPA